MANHQSSSEGGSARLALAGPLDRYYRDLVDNGLGLMCVHDLEGSLLMVNAPSAHFLGCTQEELMGKSIRDLVDHQWKSRFDLYLRRIKREGNARGFLELTTREGESVTCLYRNKLLQVPGEPTVVLGLAYDVTRRLKIARALRESNENYRRLFQEAPVAYHEIDHRGVIINVNRAECELLGRTREELLGLPVWELVVPEQQEESRTHVRLKILGSKPLQPFFREYFRKDGQRLVVQVHEKLIRSRTGDIVGIRTTLLDFTEQHRIESELRRLNAELDSRVAERTAELDASHARMREFVYTVSHDLQEPLRSISSFAKLLRDRYASRLDANGLEFLQYLISGTARMSKLIRDLLAYSRVLHDECQGFEPVELNRVVEEVTEILSNSISKNDAVIQADELPTVYADPNRMVQLFQNLIGNSIKYRSESAPEISISAESQGDLWKICIRDNGVGIKPSDRERVFGLFKRTKGAAQSGSGVGLAICQAIVERHGGRIWIEDAAAGSIFCFSLPTAG